MKGMRKIAPRKPARERKGLDHPQHKARIKLLDCVLKGKRCELTRWSGVYPNKVEVTETFAHVCGGPMDPHHTTSKGRRGSDLTVVPLCRIAHDELHRIGHREFQKRWKVALPVIASQLAGESA